MGNPKAQWPPGGAADPAGFEVLGEEYLEWLRVRDYSARTVHMRGLYIKAFAAWCAERGVARPSEVSSPMVERYQRFIFQHRQENGRPLSFASQNNRLVALRGFFRWLHRAHHIASSPAADLEMPRLGNVRLPRSVLAVGDVERVLAQPDVATSMGVRDRALMEVLYSTGMRRAELVKLKVHDVNAQRGTLLVRLGKGKKDRVVPIGERALAWLDKYLLEVRPCYAVEPDDGTIFLTVDGGPIDPGHLSKVVKDHMQAAGIVAEGACHLFRHTAATLMLENGADIRFIQEMLGHAKLSTTQIYTRVSIAKLKEIHTATHPGARLGREPRDQTPVTAEGPPGSSS